MDVVTDLFSHFAQGLDISNLPNTPADTSTIRTVVNIVLVITGAIAVLIVVIAGFRMITSQGNSTQLTQARHAIAYALIGLVVVILAFSIVNFVVLRVT